MKVKLHLSKDNKEKVCLSLKGKIKKAITNNYKQVEELRDLNL